jgi:GGDEF domain-containing protein
MLAECSRDAAELRRRDVQERIGALQLTIASGETLRLGASAGIAVYPHDGATYDALLARADRRMYRDKTRRSLREPPRVQGETRPGPAAAASPASPGLSL